MKKLALTNLIVLLAIKSVSACSVSVDPNNPNFNPVADNFFYTKTYFYSLVFFFLANFVLFFLRRQKDYLLLFLIITTAIIMLPVMYFGIMIQDCGYTITSILKWEFIIFLTIFCFQMGLWINKIGVHLQIDQGKLNIIKLQ